MSRQQSVGRWGEQAAAEYLEKQGYQILARNFRSGHSEVDIIARQENVLVFVEVKARSSNRYGYPEYAVSPKKRQHILSAAEKYILEHPEFQTWRVDVIAVEGETGKAKFTHFENVGG
jgi:putative endonuclease